MNVLASAVQDAYSQPSGQPIPFTGIDVWLVVLAALVLLAAGTAIRFSTR